VSALPKGETEEKAVEDFENTKKVYHLFAFMFSHIPIEPLLFSQVVFRDDWKVKKENIKLFLKLMRNVIAFFRPFEEVTFFNSSFTICKTTVSIEFSNLEYILEKFSINKNGEISFEELELSYKELITRELKEKEENDNEEKTSPPPKEPLRVTSRCNIHQRWLYLFILNSSNFFLSKFTRPEDFYKFKDPKFYCRAVIAAFRKDNFSFKELKARFQFNLDTLIEEATDILKEQITNELMLYSTNMLSIKNLFRRESLNNLSCRIDGFLRNYADGAFDMNKVKIHAYLHLLRIKKDRNKMQIN
jgi:hypothetical protein